MYEKRVAIYRSIKMIMSLGDTEPWMYHGRSRASYRSKSTSEGGTYQLCRASCSVIILEFSEDFYVIKKKTEIFQVTLNLHKITFHGKSTFNKDNLPGGRIDAHEASLCSKVLPHEGWVFLIVFLKNLINN